MVGYLLDCFDAGLERTIGNGMKSRFKRNRVISRAESLESFRVHCIFETRRPKDIHGTAHRDLAEDL
jgi:hypothetical protein